MHLIWTQLCDWYIKQTRIKFGPAMLLRSRAKCEFFAIQSFNVIKIIVIKRTFGLTIFTAKECLLKKGMIEIGYYTIVCAGYYLFVIASGHNHLNKQWGELNDDGDHEGQRQRPFNRSPIIRERIWRPFNIQTAYTPSGVAAADHHTSTISRSASVDIFGNVICAGVDF